MGHNAICNVISRYPQSAARLVLVGVLLSTASPCVAAASPADKEAIAFNIPAQDMESALMTFARAANVQLVINAGALNGLTAPALSGRYTPAEAMAHLLRASNLSYQWTGPRTVAIKRLAMMRPIAQRIEPSSNAVSPQESAGAQASGAPSRGAQIVDIVVTARRKAERLLDVPVAVSALSSETLERNNITSLSRVAEIVPFVSMPPVYAGAGGFFSIRGIGSPAPDPGIQQSVLINIDNVMIGRGRAASAGLFDLAQVEVLKGPQALFFGKNSPAGVVSVTTADPGNELAGFVRAGYEFEADEAYVEGAIGGPVTDTLGIRVAGRYSYMEGYIKNVAQPGPYPCSGAGCPFEPWVSAGITTPGADYKRFPHGSDWGGRITAVWTPSTTFSAKLKYSYGENKVAAYYDTFCKPGLTHFTTLGFLDTQGDCKLDRSLASSGLPPVLATNMQGGNEGRPYNHIKTHIATLNMNWDINDSLSLAAISGFYKLDSGNSFVINLSAIPAFYLVAMEHSKGISQELRLSSNYDGPVNFVIGGFTDRITQRNDNSWLFARNAIDPATGNWYTFDRFSKYVSKSQSAFGQLRWDIIDNLELAGGVRYTRETRDSLDGNTYINPNGPQIFRPVGDFFDRSLTNSNWSPEATLTWHPVPDQMVYLAYRTGYKSAGFSYPNVLTKVFTDASTTFRPERSKGFEVGYKAQLMNRRLTVQATAYTTEYKDMQVSSFDQATFGYIVGNAAKSRVKGFELQASLTPLDGLQLRGNIGYNDAHYVSFPTGPCPAGVVCPGPGNSNDLSGRQLPRAPKWQGNFGFTYETPIAASGFKIGFNGDAFFSSRYYGQDNLDPNAVQDAYWKLNAGISVGPEDDKWKLSLVGRNLTDKLVARYMNDVAGAVPGNYAAVIERPREIAIEGRFNF